MDSRKNIITIIFSISFFITLIINFIIVYADDENIDVIGKVYQFNDLKSHYEISTTDNYLLTDKDDVNTYGKFSISGNIIETSVINGLVSYGVESGNVTFSYKYSDTLLKANEDEWHIANDDNNKVDNIKLNNNIKNGALILQTSKDGNKWINDVIKTNIFKETPIQTDSFYTTSNVQLVEGCYYRFIVVYEMRIRTKTSKILFFKKNNYSYKKYAEVYEFYVHSMNDGVDIKNSLKYNLGSKIETKKDSGFFNEIVIDDDDPHYGWDLGNFFVSGYTTNVTDKEGNQVFLKNIGDKITLWFNLKQDINKLNGNEALTIAEDKNGYDKLFEINKTNFERGALIIRYTDYENIKHEPQIYTNYLAANVTTGADTKVQLFEEGDYEVALDYEIKNDKRKILNQSILPEYTDYRIYFKFSVRNSNCMIYPRDISTQSELNNSSITENGFYLDLAKSRYLDINIKKEVLQNGGTGLIEDTRYNKSAKDGDEYTEEGIYTITVKNRYTQQSTVKKIYVGKDNILKAYVKNGLSIEEINTLVSQGAEIKNDGTIIPTKSQNIVSPKKEDMPIENVNDNQQIKSVSSAFEQKNSKPIIIMIAILSIILIFILFLIKIVHKRNLRIKSNDSLNKRKMNDEEDNEK